MTVVEHIAAEPGTSEVAPSTPPMFQSLNIPSSRSKKFAVLLKFIDENPDLISMNKRNELVIEGKLSKYQS